MYCSILIFVDRGWCSSLTANIALGTRGQPNSVSLAPLQASVETPARIGIYSHTRTVRPDNVIHTTVPYNTIPYDLIPPSAQLFIAFALASDLVTATGIQAKFCLAYVPLRRPIGQVVDVSGTVFFYPLFPPLQFFPTTHHLHTTQSISFRDTWLYCVLDCRNC